jgi:hypothetical protein
MCFQDRVLDDLVHMNSVVALNLDSGLPQAFIQLLEDGGSQVFTEFGDAVQSISLTEYKNKHIKRYGHK